MKEFSLYGIGNGIVDVFLQVSEEDFTPLGFTKGTMELVPSSTQTELIEQFSGQHSGLMSGGSVANSLIVFAQLGGKAAFSTSISDDPFGSHYAEEFSKFGIHLPRPLHKGKTTGTSLIFVTPDSERTMRTNLGVSADMSVVDLQDDIAARSELTLIEGYLLLGEEEFARSIPTFAARARESGTRVALTLSDRFVVELKKELIEQILPSLDLLFANEAEACSLTGANSGDEAMQLLTNLVPNVVLTMGEKGALLKSVDSKVVHIPAFPTDTVDLTGAGDAFAGSFLYGLSTRLSLEEAGRRACWMASQVISQVGARLPGDVRALYDKLPQS